MSSMNTIQLAMDMNMPPGLIHPLLKENYNWVDHRLSELYNMYSLTEENLDEFQSNGLLKNRWEFVDSELERLYNEFPHSVEILRPAVIPWANYRSNAELECLEEEETIGSKRKRLSLEEEEEDEPDRKRVRISSGNEGKNAIFITINSLMRPQATRWRMEHAVNIVSDDEDEEIVK